MTISTDEMRVQASEVMVNKTDITVHLIDGRTIIVPLVCYLRLKHASLKERNNWKLIGKEESIDR